MGGPRRAGPHRVRVEANIRVSAESPGPADAGPKFRATPEGWARCASGSAAEFSPRCRRLSAKRAGRCAGRAVRSPGPSSEIGREPPSALGHRLGPGSSDASPLGRVERGPAYSLITPPDTPAKASYGAGAPMLSFLFRRSWAAVFLRFGLAGRARDRSLRPGSGRNVTRPRSRRLFQ